MIDSNIEKESFMSDEKVFEITDFKRIGDEIVRIRREKAKKSKKKKEEETQNQPDFFSEDVDFETELVNLVETIEYLQQELLAERVKRQTLEKLLNKFFKNQQDTKKGESE